MFIEIEETSLAFNYERITKFTFRNVRSISFEVSNQNDIIVLVNTIDGNCESFPYSQIINKNSLISIQGD